MIKEKQARSRGYWKSSSESGMTTVAKDKTHIGGIKKKRRKNLLPWSSAIFIPLPSTFLAAHNPIQSYSNVSFTSQKALFFIYIYKLQHKTAFLLDWFHLRREKWKPKCRKAYCWVWVGVGIKLEKSLL